MLAIVVLRAKMAFPSNLRFGLVFVAAVFSFWATVGQLKSAPRQVVHAELQVALPLSVQVLMTMGDRYLAANVASIRSLVVETQKMKPDEFAILAKLQQDVARLNPGHEDNYYIAAAILPWVGEVTAAQDILARATKARRYDYQPAFFYGFNQLHFLGDAAGASTWLREAAEHLPEGGDRTQMRNLAAIWVDKAGDVDLAIRIVEAMAKQEKRRDFRAYLETRVVRLKALKGLRAAAIVYRDRYGQPPGTFEDLVSSGVLLQMPVDPFGFGFAFDKRGDIVLRNSPAPTK